MRIQKIVGGGLAALVWASTALGVGSDWTVPGDFATIQEAIDSNLVVSGDVIRVGSGDHYGALVTKAVEIKGAGDARIVDGPPHSSGMSHGFRLLHGSDGATISHLTFTTDLAIMNGDGVDDVTITQCTFLNAVQAVSNWRGSRWQINHNEIIDLRTRCGGGIGILVADYDGGSVNDNVVSHNKISGTLHVSDGDCGGYSGTGIVLYADFRWGRAGTADLSWNRVVKNKVDLVSDTPSLVDVWAFELSDTRNISLADPVIHDNAIGFNEWRGMNNQIALTPSDLDASNPISRNLGENRGQGLHPGLFGPN